MGSKTARIDLHLHSPAGGDYRGDPMTTPGEIVCRCAEVGLNLVVIADHMTVDAWEHFRDLSRPHGTGPYLLPGAELKVKSADREIHLVVVFTPERARADFALLSETLSPLIGRNGSLSTTQIAADPAFIAGLVKRTGALCIAAHVDRFEPRTGSRSDYSLVRTLVAAGVIDAVEFDDAAAADGFAETCPAVCIVSSDAHSLDEIGKRSTELVLDQLSFEGLRRALNRPGSGSRRLEDREAACPRST